MPSQNDLNNFLASLVAEKAPAGDKGAPRTVYVLGAGVIGLSTAVYLRHTHPEYRVVLVAEYFPDDEKNIKYTSCWAGAFHNTGGQGTDEKTESPGGSWNKLLRRTRKVFEDMMDNDPADEVPLMRAPQTDLYTSTYGPIDDSLINGIAGSRRMTKEELPSDVVHGIHYEVITVDTPNYLLYLQNIFLSYDSNTQRIKASLDHITDLFEIATKNHLPQPDLIVNCTGLGSKTLGGVKDENVFPTRGQVVLVNAPWMKESRAKRFKPTDVAYMINRKNGVVTLGGTFEVGDDYPEVRPETAAQIRERCLALQPELLPPEKRAGNNVEDLDVLHDGVGLRPSRKGGIRIQKDELITSKEGTNKIPIVHHYGHGGSGYDTSWGSAFEAVNLVEEILASK